MTAHKMLYEWCDQSRMISGKKHHLAKRFDGVCFYLDDVFRFALEHFAGREDLEHELLNMGARPEEIGDMLKLLELSGLVEVCDSDE